MVGRPASPKPPDAGSCRLPAAPASDRGSRRSTRQSRRCGARQLSSRMRSTSVAGRHPEANAANARRLCELPRALPRPGGRSAVADLRQAEPGRTSRRPWRPKGPWDLRRPEPRAHDAGGVRDLPARRADLRGEHAGADGSPQSPAHRAPLGATPLSAMRTSQVQSWVRTKQQELSPRTVRLLFLLLSSILNAAVDDERIAKSPCRSPRSSCRSSTTARSSRGLRSRWSRYGGGAAGAVRRDADHDDRPGPQAGGGVRPRCGGRRLPAGEPFACSVR